MSDASRRAAEWVEFLKATERDYLHMDKYPDVYHAHAAAIITKVDTAIARAVEGERHKILMFLWEHGRLERKEVDQLDREFAAALRAPATEQPCRTCHKVPKGFDHARGCPAADRAPGEKA